MLRALALTLFLATPAYAASIPDMRLHMNGGGQSPDVWVGDTAKLVFLPATSDGGRWSAPQDSRFEVMMHCTDTSIAYTVEETGGDYTLIPKPPQWERPVEPRCTETERDTLNVIGKRVAKLDGDTLDFGSGYRFTRTAPSPELAELRNALMLEAGFVWTPAEPPEFTRGNAITLSYGVDTVGGFDGCNGWGADYTLVDGWSGPREYRRSHRSTLVYCGNLYDDPDTSSDRELPLAGDRWMEVTDGELHNYPSHAGSHYVAVDAAALKAQTDTRNRDALQKNIMDTLALAPGQSWHYIGSDFDTEETRPGLRRALYFDTLNRDSVTGRDGCNRFGGARATLVTRESGFGLELSGDMIATEMACPTPSGRSAVEIFGLLFAPDTRVEAHGDTLTFRHPTGTVQFEKAPAT